MLLVSQYLRSRTTNIRLRFLHLCCMDQEKLPSFGSMAANTSLKSSVGGFDAYSSTSGSGGFNFGSSKGGSEFETLT